MPTIRNKIAALSICVDHSLSEEDAVVRMKKLLAEFCEEYANDLRNFESAWSEHGTARFCFFAMDACFEGTIAVGSSGVEINLALPSSAMPLRDDIKSAAREHMRQALS